MLFRRPAIKDSVRRAGYLQVKKKKKIKKGKLPYIQLYQGQVSKT